jgi:transposase InsO family protein
MFHLVPYTKTTTAPEFAQMFIDYVIRLHGILDSIVSDRGSIFTSQFWTVLSKTLDLKKRLSTAFHPQTDGQVERMNQVIEQYLRIYCNYQQDNWSQLLSLAEFSYNNAQHA